MKRRNLLKFFPIVMVCLCAEISFSQVNSQSLNGAWKFEAGDGEQVLVFQDGYFSQTSYNESKKEFNYTRGGKVVIMPGKLQVKFEFNSADKDEVGTSAEVPVILSAGKLVTHFDGVKQEWKKIDDGAKNLAGCWRINGRWDGKEMHPIKEAPRKTLKLLSATRFQWFAINTETKEFFGTGGGTYTLNDGKYVENIDFFSRDNSRVGAKLSFDAEVYGDIWHHSGLSSKNDPIKETWIRYKAN